MSILSSVETSWIRGASNAAGILDAYWLKVRKSASQLEGHRNPINHAGFANHQG